MEGGELHTVCPPNGVGPQVRNGARVWRHETSKIQFLLQKRHIGSLGGKWKISIKQRFPPGILVQILRMTPGFGTDLGQRHSLGDTVESFKKKTFCAWHSEFLSKGYIIFASYIESLKNKNCFLFKRYSTLIVLSKGHFFGFASYIDSFKNKNYFASYSEFFVETGIFLSKGHFLVLRAR